MQIEYTIDAICAYEPKFKAKRCTRILKSAELLKLERVGSLSSHQSIIHHFTLIRILVLLIIIPPILDFREKVSIGAANPF